MFFLVNRDDELATEIAWVVVYLSALSTLATSVLVKTDLLQLLVERLASSNSLQLLIPVTRNICQLLFFANMFTTFKLFDLFALFNPLDPFPFLVQLFNLIQI